MNKCCLLGEQINDSYRVLHEGNNFIVTPALGQLGIEGYLLICSKEHFVGICGMPANLDSELEIILDKTRQIISEHYTSNILVFEHGPRLGCYKGGGCLEHAHLHVVPTGVDVAGFLRDKDFVLEEVSDFSRLRNIHSEKKSSYLFLETQVRRRFVCEVDVLPSQYLRRVIANLEVRDNWDWRTYPDYDSFYATLKKLRGKFENE